MTDPLSSLVGAQPITDLAQSSPYPKMYTIAPPKKPPPFQPSPSAGGQDSPTAPIPDDIMNGQFTFGMDRNDPRNNYTDRLGEFRSRFGESGVDRLNGEALKRLFAPPQDNHNERGRGSQGEDEAIDFFGWHYDLDNATKQQTPAVELNRRNFKQRYGEKALDALDALIGDEGASDQKDWDKLKENFRKELHLDDQM